MPSNRRNLRSRNRELSESSTTMETANGSDAIDDDVDDNIFEIDKFVHSFGFKATNSSKDEKNIIQEYIYFKSLLATEKKVFPKFYNV